MLIDLKKYFSGEDISQAIDYTVDLSEVCHAGSGQGQHPFVRFQCGAERGGALCVFDAVQQVLDVDA